MRVIKGQLTWIPRKTILLIRRDFWLYHTAVFTPGSMAFLVRKFSGWSRCDSLNAKTLTSKTLFCSKLKNKMHG